MISIDRILFEFGMNDEPFAQSLYAEWDSFCRTCFENIVEECLSAYDKDRMLHEIETLDLDLGSIPQEEFYSEFPRRLREELLKVVPPLQLGQADMEEVKTVASRFANLLYYLEYGVLKTEWADIGFNLSEELTGLMKQDKRYMEKITGLCMANEHVLRRLLLQTDNDAPLVHLYSIAMDQTFSVKDEKRRFMEIFLEMQPDLPVRFVHEMEEDGRLRGMAELLDTRSVHKIMEKETEEHAEVDIPPYWHYLYEWLIKYYPYNGVAIFGGKSDFISHLHYRLLTFIHKRNNTFYLSKTELVAAFLLEVFGAVYYKEALNAIYNMQPRNADGSPAYDGYYNRELYRIFMRLSLLNLPETSGNVVDVNVPKKDTDCMELYSLFESKHELLQTLVREKPQELVGILRNLSRGEETVPLMATHIPTEVLLDVVEKIDAKQALLLSRTIDLLQRERGRFAFLSTMTMPFTTALSEALLLFMQDNDTLGGRNLTEQEVVGKFLFHLYYVYTRKTDYNDNAEWKYLQDEVTNGLGLNGTETASISEVTISERLLSEYGSLNDSEVYHLMVTVLNKQPELFIKLSEKDIDTDFIRRISGIADRAMLKRIVTVLSSVSGFENHTTFIRLMEWLDIRSADGIPASDIVSVLLSWINTTDWKRQAIRQMTLFFISRLYGSDDTANFIATNDAARFTYNVDKAEVVRSFFLSFPTIEVTTKIKKEEMMSEMMKNLGITPEEERMFERSQEGNSEIAFIGNAGLCLLSPWFPRLFVLLGYLDDEKRNFKDTVSRIRAVFVLQYLACTEVKDYHESELVFNRLLVALPAHIPLPKRIELTDEEKQMADNMLEGVRANWSKMNGTSVSGFRQSFVVRDGRLEQQDEKWLLTVEDRAYDILLESVPWGFRQIRFPWLKKYVQVSWHERQRF